VAEQFVSISPIKVDLTAHHALDPLARWLGRFA
jgi:hypothetical protein